MAMSEAPVREMKNGHERVARGMLNLGIDCVHCSPSYVAVACGNQSRLQVYICVAI